MTNCTHCGAELDPGAQFCGTCGATVDAPEAGHAGAPAPEAANAAPPAPLAAAPAVDRLLAYARGAKVLALLAFLLPWVTVSCAGRQLYSATGTQLATGAIPIERLRAPGAPAPTETAQAASTLDPFVLGAALLIIVGLIASFVIARRRTAGITGLVTSAVAAGVIAYDILIRIRGEAMARIREGSGLPGPDAPQLPFQNRMEEQAQRLSELIVVEAGSGFWLTMFGLVAAVIVNWMILSERPRPFG
jgi:hypothetical protein